VRLSTVAHEREGRLGRARQAGVGHGQKVGLELWVNVEARGGARHSMADRACVRRRLSSERQMQVAS
jgi:hypothetical protein